MSEARANPGLVIGLTVIDVAATVGMLSIYFAVIPQFVSLFQNFGANLPFLTQLVVARPGPWWSFVFLNVVIQQVVLILFVVRDKPAAKRVLLATFWGTLWVDAAALVVGIVGVYLPIFELGQAI